MRIAFDAKRLFCNYTGLGNYSRSLVDALIQTFPEHEYFLYSPKLIRNSETEAFYQRKGVHLIAPSEAKPFLWRTRGILKNLVDDRIDVYHGLSHEIPIGIAKQGLKSVVSIHDLIFKKYPRQYAGMDRFLYNQKFRYACKHADRIIAISESTKRDIMYYYNIPEERVQVIYQDCNTVFKVQQSRESLDEIAKKYALPKDFILYTGSIQERKNLMLLAEAYSELKEDFQIPVVLVGSGKAYLEKLKRKLHSLGLNSRFRFLSLKSNADLAGMYQLASLFVYPSMYEGFGLPVLESMHSGTAVITSNVSSLPEVSGDAAIQVDPFEVSDLKHAIEKMLSDDDFRSELVEKGKIQAKKFEQQRNVVKIMSLYQNL